MNEFAQLLQTLGFRASDKIIIGARRSGRGKISFAPALVSQADQVQAALTEMNAWYSVCPIRSDWRATRPNQRNTAADAVALRTLWVDLDLAPDKLPSKGHIDATLASLTRIMGEPAARVFTGGGVHAYWPIDPIEWSHGNQGALLQAQHVVKSWGRAVKKAAIEAGGAADTVFDLARIMRIPGTKNVKGLKL